jgi:small subunit ribosomal protein S2
MVEKKDEFLVPNEDYLKAGIHIGTKFKTKYMEKFIYKTRPDGLSVLNIQRIDERIRQVVNLLSYYKPEEILLVSRRENGWKPISLFAKLTGCKFFAGRYPPGLMTNPNLSTFIEAKLVFVVDSWPDRNAVKDALKVGIPVVALCDSNNQTNGIDFVVPCNNKGKKSLGLIFYLISREYMKKLGLIKADAEFKHSVEDFTAE